RNPPGRYRCRAPDSATPTSRASGWPSSAASSRSSVEAAGRTQPTSALTLALEATARRACMKGGLAPGTTAPDFSLQSTPDPVVSLTDFRGQRAILAFYPADWSPVCGDQMALYNEMLDEFRRFQAELFGISVDGAWCHAAYAKQNKLRFPLLADFEPKGAVASAYGVYDENEGTC